MSIRSFPGSYRKEELFGRTGLKAPRRRYRYKFVTIICCCKLCNDPRDNRTPRGAFIVVTKQSLSFYTVSLSRSNATYNRYQPIVAFFRIFPSVRYAYQKFLAVASRRSRARKRLFDNNRSALGMKIFANQRANKRSAVSVALFYRDFIAPDFHGVNHGSSTAITWNRYR